MPLLNGKPHKPKLPEKGINENRKIFHIKETGEVFQNYDDYIKTIMHYSSQVWACACTRKKELNYSEALRSEELAARKLNVLTEQQKECLISTIKDDVGSSVAILTTKCINALQSMNQKSGIQIGKTELTKNDSIIVDDSSDKENSGKPIPANSQSDKASAKLPSSSVVKIFLNWYRYFHTKETSQTTADKPTTKSKPLIKMTDKKAASSTPKSNGNKNILQNKIHPFFSSTPNPTSSINHDSVIISSSDSEADEPLSKIISNIQKNMNKSPQKPKSNIFNVLKSESCVDNGGNANNKSQNKVKKIKEKKASMKIELTLSSDSESDVPLAKLRNSPKQKPQQININQAKVSPGGQQLQLVVGKKLTQKTLFEVRTKFVKSEECINQKSLHSLFPIKQKPTNPNQAAADAEKARLQLELLARSRQKREDLEVDNLKPLPPPKPVEMPEGLSGSFGDVMMIVEFIHSFSSILLPSEKFTVTSDDLKIALGNGEKGFGIVSQVLLIFLRFLLADEEDSKVPEYALSLVDLPLTAFTMSDVLYHYLRVKLADKSSDETDEEMADELEETEDERIPTSCSMLLSNKPKLLKGVLHELKTEEFYTLPASHQLMVLVYLYTQLMESIEFGEVFRGALTDMSVNWRELNNLRKEKNKRTAANSEEKNQKEKSEVTKKLEDCFAKKSDTESTGQDATKTPEADNAVTKTPETKTPETDVNPETKATTTTIDITESPTETASDLAQLVRQRRILSMKQIVWKEEQEKKDKERRMLNQEEMTFVRKIDNTKENIQRFKDMLRVKPLGQDRYHRLYWLFKSKFTGLYIEDGWSYNNGEQKERNSWYRIESVSELDSLLATLATNGLRESALRSQIRANYKSIATKYKKRLEPTENVPDYNAVLESFNALKEDIIESGQRITKGTLGSLESVELWEESINKSETKEDLIPLILELQSSIFSGCLQGNLKSKTAMSNWVECLKSCQTLSSLHSLLGILENSIKWESSIENAKCKVCRKKASSGMAICDWCNHVYHVNCLRPTIDYVPPRGWKCNMCQPSESRKRRSRTVEIVSDNEDADEQNTEEESDVVNESDYDDNEEDDDDDDDHESYCSVCQEGGDLICCDTCPKVYHLSCHEPAIRRLPRGAWSCFECRCPSRRTRRNGKAQSHKAGKSKNSRKRQVTESESDEEESPPRKTNSKSSNNRATKNSRQSSRMVTKETSDESSDDEEDDSKNNRKSKRSNKRKIKDSDEDGENSNEESSGETKQISRKRTSTSRKTKPKSKRSSVSDNEDEETESRNPRKTTKSRRTANRKVRNVEEDSSNGDSNEETKTSNNKTTSSRRKTKRSRQLPLSDEEDNDSESEEKFVTPASRRKNKRLAVESSSDESNENDKTIQAVKKARVVVKIKQVNGRAKLQEASNSRRGRKQRGNYELTACENVINGLRNDKNAWPFLVPVDPDKVTDYAKFVTDPIDLQTIKEKLDGIVYEDAFEFIQDVNLLFANSKKYNQDNSDVGISALALEDEFQHLMSIYLPQLASALTAD